MSQGEGEVPPGGGLDDPELLAEIEAEFAELTAEIERINAMPRSMAPKKAELVKSLRDQWFAKQEARGDRPEWRTKMDEALGEAITKVLEEGITETPDGRMEFNLRNDSVQTHGGPLMEALLTGFRHMLAEKLTKERKPAPGAAPPNPLQGLMLGLGQMLVQALDNTKKDLEAKKTAPAEAPETTVTQRDTGAGAVEVKVTPGGGTTVETEVTTIDTSVSFDTRKGDQVPPILPQMFQGLLANLGGILNQATRGAAAEAKSQAAPAPPAGGAAAEAKAEAKAKADAEAEAGAKAEAVAGAEAGAGAEAEAVAGAEAGAGAEAEAVAGAEADAEAGAEAKAGAEAGAGAEAAPAGVPVEELVAAVAASLEAAKRPVTVKVEPRPEATADAAADKPQPSVRIDFAGLLGQLFKLAPHGLATRRPEGKAADPEAAPGDPGEDAATPKAPGPEDPDAPGGDG